jgi:selenocysteine lyase/cysteine desulfurase
MIEDTRDKLQNFFNLNNQKQVVFTPSATIAINTIIKGIDWNKGDNVYYSPFEHNATLRSLNYVQKKENIKLHKIDFNKDFNINYKVLEEDFKNKKPKLVIISQVSNVCGNIMDIDKLAVLVHKYNGYLMVDGAQGAGLINIDYNNIDYYVWAGHKSLYGPFGISGFILDHEALKLNPFIHGGTGTASELKTMPENLPQKFEGGSTNVLAIAGLNAALEWIEEETISKIFKKENELLLKLREILQSFLNTNLYLPPEEFHHNVISVNFSGYNPNDIAKILDDKYDIAVRSGLHCSPEAHKFLGTFPHGTVRFSIGYFNTFEELDKLKLSLEEFII